MEYTDHTEVNAAEIRTSDPGSLCFVDSVVPSSP